jgi:phosphoenolpyruvate carboxykinase (diphosphate)
MNNAVVSAILTGYAGFTSAAGFIGPKYRVDHDISMLVPEIWCRMTVTERDPKFLIEHGYLEQITDFEFEGRTVLASRLGYRINERFLDHFLGRLFETPNVVFTNEMLQPEKQDLAAFAAGVNAIVDAQTRVAQTYFDDGSVEAACPPLQALLHIMVYGNYSGMSLEHPTIRRLFSRDVLLSSDWYRERLETKRRRDLALWRRHESSINAAARNTCADALELQRNTIRAQLVRLSSPDYLSELIGTLGADPLHLQMSR